MGSSVSLPMTPSEKQFVARRAFGEFAVQGLVEGIWRQYKKERSIYTAFLALVCSSRGWTADEYAAVAKPILDLHPNPWSKKEKKASADPPLKPNPRQGLAALKKALTEPWPTRDVGRTRPTRSDAVK